MPLLHCKTITTLFLVHSNCFCRLLYYCLQTPNYPQAVHISGQSSSVVICYIVFHATVHYVLLQTSHILLFLFYLYMNQEWKCCSHPSNWWAWSQNWRYNNFQQEVLSNRQVFSILTNGLIWLAHLSMQLLRQLKRWKTA